MPRLNAHLKTGLYAFALLLIVFFGALRSVEHKRQLGGMGGMAEEYMALGLNMYYTGRFYLSETSDVPFVFRPPGYVKYLDLVLKCYGGVKPQGYQFRSQSELEAEVGGMMNAVYVSQCALLAAASLVLFLWMGSVVRPLYAFGVALVFGLNPYLIILAGLLHYEILHIFMVLLSAWLMSLGLRGGRSGLVFLALSGVSWGLTTLVRPLSLIIPALFAVLLLFHLGRRWKSLLVHLVLFTVMFAGTLAPWTWRNYQCTSRFIPVNAQKNVALWAGSLMPLDLDSNHYRWWQIWYPSGQQIYEQVTGNSDAAPVVYADHVIRLEDRFGQEFKNNVSARPGIYLGNVVKNVVLLGFGINSVFIKLFQYNQLGQGINPRWLARGDPQTFYSSGAANAFSGLVWLLTLTSLAGMWLAVRKKDKRILVPLLSFLTLLIAHSITYMDLMYYYVKVPFLFVFTAFFLEHLGALMPAPAAVWTRRCLMTCVCAGTSGLYLVLIA